MVYKYSLCKDNVEIGQSTTFVHGNLKVKMKLPFSDKSIVLKSPYYRGVFLWNQLDYKLQHIDGEYLFGKAIRRVDTERMKMYE